MKVFLVGAMCLGLCACVSRTSHMYQIDLTPIKTGEVTIIEEKTTKQELLKVLGAPTSASTSSMTWWRSENPQEYFVVNYIQKDGTQLEACVGQLKKCKSNVSVNFYGIFVGDKDINEKQNIVSSVDL